MFYGGHLVIDATGDVEVVEDGGRRVRAQRVLLDLRANRMLAAGDVVVTTGDARQAGAAYAEDLRTRKGTLIAAGGLPPADAGREPLALPETGGEAPFVVARAASVHLGADVRLTDARVIAAGAHAVPLPSFVYTFSPDTGYVVSNIARGGENLPIFIGSTRNSVQALHFQYNPQTRFDVGIDERLVYGSRAYDVLSLSPLIGPNKILNATWQRQINAHTNQTLTSSTMQGVGTFNSLDLRDGLHRSFVSLDGTQFRGQHAAEFAWQGYDQRMGPGGGIGDLSFHLRSAYGYSHASGVFAPPPYPSGTLQPATIFHDTFESFVATAPLRLNPATTLLASADLRMTFDTLPHRQFARTYGSTLSMRLNRFVSASLFDGETPLLDSYPGLSTAYLTHFSTQIATLSYANRDSSAFALNFARNAARTNNPSGLIVQPYSLALDMRVRLGRSLMLDLSRSYAFGFEGQRFGPLGVQVLP